MRDPLYEYALVTAGSTRRRLLQRRIGSDDAWQPIAYFDSYNDAEWIVKVLNGHLANSEDTVAPTN